MKAGNVSQLHSESSSDYAANAVDALDPEKRSLLKTELELLISAREQGIRYAESRMNSLGLLSGGLIATALGVASVGSNQASRGLRFTLTGTSIGLIVLSIALLIAFIRSTNPPYPFIARGADLRNSRWKWFYWDALPNAQKFATINILGGQKRAMRSQEIQETNDQFELFVDRMIEGSTTDVLSTAEDLRQLYTLHINERYKNAYLTNLRKLLRYGLVITLIFALLGLGLGQVDRPLEGTSSQRSNSLAMEFSWTEVSRSNGMVDLMLTIEIASTRDSNYTLSTLAAFDESGFLLPLSSDFRRVAIASHSVQTISVEIRSPRSYVGSIFEWQVS